MTATVRRARQVALGLAVFDAAFAAVALVRPEVPARLLGAEESGFYSDWGVGQLMGYALVQALTAASPSRSRLDAVAGLRTAAIAADLVAAGRGRRSRRATFLAVALGNAVAARLARRAALALPAQHEQEPACA